MGNTLQRCNRYDGRDIGRPYCLTLAVSHPNAMAIALHRWQDRFHPVRARLRKNPQARLRSPAEVAIAAALGCGIDANRATIDDWLRLPGISIHQARTLATLSQNGVAFFALEDIATALGIAVTALEPLAAAIHFRYYEPTGAPTQLDLNRTTVAQLMQVPGLPRDWAEWIVRSRQDGPFRDLAEFQRRCQVPPVAMARWMHYLRVG
ncbi:MAG: helix-hairpin-helix domain-containing protein [Leptolyngbya sp.]|nr:helix-hairpin-helix domain-containing protein [Leptolyngbya sp.]